MAWDVFEAFVLSLRWVVYVEAVFVFAIYWPAGLDELRRLRDPRSIDDDRTRLMARIEALGTPDEYYRRVNVAVLLLGMGLIVTGLLVEGVESLVHLALAWVSGEEYHTASSMGVRLVRNTFFMLGFGIKLIPWLQGAWGRRAPLWWLACMGILSAALTMAILVQGATAHDGFLGQ